MDASLAVQYVLVAIAVLLSAWVVMAKQFPQLARRMRIAIAVPLLREGRPVWLRWIARRVAPAGSSGAGSACGGCDSCGPSPKR